MFQLDPVDRPGVLPMPRIDVDSIDWRAEHGVHSWSLDHVIRKGTPTVARMAADLINVRDRFRDLHPGLFDVCDVRVQRLMPGMFPSIPGWHCDDVPRNGYHSQPDLGAARNGVGHVVGTLSSSGEGVSRTEFVAEEMASFRPITDEPVWRQLHRHVEEGEPATWRAPDGWWVPITWRTPHRATPAVRRGFRIFFRMSMRPRPAHDEPQDRTVEQVYLLTEENGW